LDVPKGVYYPREDSELLINAIEKMDIKNRNTLEIGCGSGILSIIMTKMGATVTAIDINPNAIKTTKINAEKNNVKINTFISDMFQNVKGKFDLIVFNPPYLPTEENEKDIIYSGGVSGRETIKKFIEHVKEYLKNNGKVLVIISSLTGEREVLNLFNSVGMKSRIVTREKIPWEELIVIEAQY